ncbi:unnamed protein product [Cylicostephanus goldi]|uniref:Uncharacterized protein n=1 Tax=Cylicostephanus goldi TaxID=71465 RepID=A0A3P7QRZ3_CYLGO|nr:unnamed protein product [Cylicostephanus goldi]
MKRPKKDDHAGILARVLVGYNGQSGAIVLRHVMVDIEEEKESVHNRVDAKVVLLRWNNATHRYICASFRLLSSELRIYNL